MKILFYLLLCLSQVCCVATSSGQSRLNIAPVTAQSSIKSVTADGTYFTVSRVFDGDTLKLEDGRKIRFLGINTPEIAHYRRPNEAGGDSARIWLKDKLEKQKVRLEIGLNSTDKYGRTLAHVFNQNNEHINLELVKRGLASVDIYPPDLDYVNELTLAEQEAQKAGLGIWQLPDYAPIAVAALTDADHHGWTRVIGQITAVRQSKKYYYLVMSSDFSVRIEQAHKALFGDIQAYQGKTVEVRGWVLHSNRRLLMQVRHPNAIQFL